MSTRSRIARMANGSIDSIYCHAGGHTNGTILIEHYQDPAKIEALIGLGALSLLGPELGEQHSFAGHHDTHRDWCLAYGRDRRDAECEAMQHHRLLEYSAYVVDEGDIEFAYLWWEGAWWVATRDGLRAGVLSAWQRVTAGGAA